MLVLSRRPNEKILFPGFQTSVQVLSVKPGVVRLGIDAPPEVTVLREEVHDRQGEWQAPTPPAAARLERLNELLQNRLRILAGEVQELRTQLEAGWAGEAPDTLERIEEELRLLQCRLAGEAGQEAPAVPRRRALLVEDNDNERELLARFLRRGGIDVDTARDGTDALDYLGSNRPDVVLLDMGMPRCDGPTAVRAIRQNPALSDLKIYAVTGHTPDEYNLPVGPGGIDRWFHKPFNPDLLLHDLCQSWDAPATRSR